MQIVNDIKLDFGDVLIKPKRSTLTTRSGVSIEKEYDYLHALGTDVLTPIMAANMDATGTFAMADALIKHNMHTCLHKHYSPEDLIKFFSDRPTNTAWPTIGIKKEDVEKLDAIKAKLGHIPRICIDVANGYQKVFVDHVKKIREENPHAVIMAGNVCTPEMVSELLISGGADIIKIGIGPGSVCSTRKITGCGYPQLSAIIECADAAHGIGGLICSDGGCVEPGDVVKAFAAGADFVMLGGMLAGTDECEGEWEWEADMIWNKNKESTPFTSGTINVNSEGKVRQRKKAMKFYGMSSKNAMDKHSGGVADYRASEGETLSVLYKGPVKDTVKQILGGIRSACAYVGASRLKDLPKCTTFVRVK